MLQAVLGKIVSRPAKLDRKLVRELKAMHDPDDPYDTVTGKTMCTYDFYEGNCIFLILIITVLKHALQICQDYKINKVENCQTKKYLNCGPRHVLFHGLL